MSHNVNYVNFNTDDKNWIKSPTQDDYWPEHVKNHNMISINSLLKKSLPNRLFKNSKCKKQKKFKVAAYLDRFEFESRT